MCTGFRNNSIKNFFHDQEIRYESFLSIYFWCNLSISINYTFKSAMVQTDDFYNIDNLTKLQVILFIHITIVLIGIQTKKDYTVI